jgi:4-hydroxybenzoate polyprenyltransferase
MTKQLLIQKLDAYERLMRLDKPIGILLLLWPTLWALLIAGQGRPNLYVVLIFVTGTVLMRSAGCVMNDIADRRFDGMVERTKLRPLATQEVSVREARYLALVLCLMAFALVCFLNRQTILLSIAALFLATTYPLTKRFLAIPQAYLGIAFGFGIPMAFAAINDYVPPLAWQLLLANVFWAIAYDTAYAMVDRDDDAKIGIQSSALFFGRFDVLAIMLCFVAMLGILIYVGLFMGYGMFYFSGLLLTTLLVLKQYGLIKKRLKTECFKAFLQNSWIGAAVTLGLFLELIFK